MKKMTFAAVLCAGLLVCGQMCGASRTIFNRTAANIDVTIVFSDGSEATVTKISPGPSGVKSNSLNLDKPVSQIKVKESKNK